MFLAGQKSSRPPEFREHVHLTTSDCNGEFCNSTRTATKLYNTIKPGYLPNAPHSHLRCLRIIRIFVETQVKAEQAVGTISVRT